MNILRFQVKHLKDGSYVIVDKEYKRWKMPRLAVSLHFKAGIEATDICERLNKEWIRFQRNPE